MSKENLDASTSGLVAWQSDAKGGYVRPDSQYRNWISKENDETATFPAEANRYHLYISLACPWACRTAAMRTMKGLEDVISMSIVHPIWKLTRPNDANDGHAGWTFVDDSDNAQPFLPPHGDKSSSASDIASYSVKDNAAMRNTINAAKNVRELYDLSNPSTPTAKYTIPILWDKKNSVIVNNESEEIVRIFNSCFNAFAKNPSLDVYPAHLKEIIDGVNSQVYPNINNGVYRTGFAKTQLAYDDASKNLFNTMDHFEKVLSTQRYVTAT